MRKSDKKQPAKARVAVRSPWHDMALRYWLFLERAYPHNRTSRYELVRQILNHVEGAKFKDKPLTLDAVTQALKRMAKTAKAWRCLYAKAEPEELLDSSITTTPTERDVMDAAYMLSLSPDERGLITKAQIIIERHARQFEKQWRKTGTLPKTLPPTRWLLKRILQGR